MNDQMQPSPTDPGSATAAADAFPSLSALRSAHNELLEAHREQGDSESFWQEIESFLLRGRATGALLDSEDERWAAQSLLDYWAATGYSIGREMPDAVLEEFDPTLAPEIPDEQCPYVGLAAFREVQRPYFFGRQQLVETLIEKIRADRLLAVVGSSGSGKSSAVLAGLLPALRAGAVPAQDDRPASDQWRYSKRMVPGSNPLASLERAILPAQGEGESLDTALAAKFLFVADGCRRERDYLLKLLNESGDTPFVLVVDQFEEIFTLCRDETLRLAFLHNLLALVQQPRSHHRVILTMRTDFESFVARVPAFQPHFEEAVVRVTPLNAAELRAVIEKPAALVGLKFEDGVVDALVQDVLGEPAALPLLQFTLLKLWEDRDRNRITWESYKKLGGGRLALARSADQLYTSLIPEEQVTARRILLRLVRPGDGLEVTSNRVRRSVLYQSGEARDRVDRVLDRLVVADLLRVSSAEKVEDTQVEVAHEALVRNWPRLVGWLEDERGRLRERLRLTEAAEQWLKLGRDPSALLRGTLLDNAAHYPDLSELEYEFVEESLAAREAAAAEQEAARQRELEQARALAAEQQERAEAESKWAQAQTLAAAKLRQRALLLGLSTVAALVLAGLAVWLGYEATDQRNNAIVQYTTATAAVAIADQAREEAVTQVAFAIAAQGTAEAERALALTAEAEVRAEQTRVRHLENAIDYTAEQLDQLQGEIAVALGTPPTPTPTPRPATPTPRPVAPTPVETTALLQNSRSPTAVATTTGRGLPLPSPTPLVATTNAGAATPEILAVVADGTTAIISPTQNLSYNSSLFVITDTGAFTTTVRLTGTSSNLVANGAFTTTIVPDRIGMSDAITEVAANQTSANAVTSPITATTLTTPTGALTAVVAISPSLIAIVPEIDVSLYAEPSEKATVLQTLRAPLQLPVLEADSFWVQVLLPTGRTGWVQAWLLTYRGDAKLLPLELRYLVISEQVTPVQQSSTLPFTYGTLISFGGAEGDYLLNDPQNEQSGLVWVPVGTDVTLLFEAKGASSYGSGVWYFVSLVDPMGENLIWRGYLPAEVLAPRQQTRR